MAYATPRSCREALHEGATDGAEWKPLPNRGGVVTSKSNQDVHHPPTMVGLFGMRGTC